MKRFHHSCDECWIGVYHWFITSFESPEGPLSSTDMYCWELSKSPNTAENSVSQQYSSNWLSISSIRLPNPFRRSSVNAATKAALTCLVSFRFFKFLSVHFSTRLDPSLTWKIWSYFSAKPMDTVCSVLSTCFGRFSLFSLPSGSSVFLLLRDLGFLALDFIPEKKTDHKKIELPL